MESGKLDEELARMSDIADQITPTACCCATSRSPPPTNGKARRLPVTSSTRCWPSTSRSCLSRTCSTWPIASTNRTAGPRCFSARNAGPTEHVRSDSLRASRCRPATARIPIGRFLAGASARQPLRPPTADAMPPRGLYGWCDSMRLAGDAVDDGEIGGGSRADLVIARGVEGVRRRDETDKQEERSRQRRDVNCSRAAGPPSGGAWCRLHGQRAGRHRSPCMRRQ
jgi:hypothetical protein